MNSFSDVIGSAQCSKKRKQRAKNKGGRRLSSGIKKPWFPVVTAQCPLVIAPLRVGYEDIPVETVAISLPSFSPRHQASHMRR